MVLSPLPGTWQTLRELCHHLPSPTGTWAHTTVVCAYDLRAVTDTMLGAFPLNGWLFPQEPKKLFLCPKRMWVLQANGPFGGGFSQEVWGWTSARVTGSGLSLLCFLRVAWFNQDTTLSGPRFPHLDRPRRRVRPWPLILCPSLLLPLPPPVFSLCSHSPPLPGLQRAWATLGSRSTEWCALLLIALQLSCHPWAFVSLPPQWRFRGDQNHDWLFKSVKCSPGCESG